MSAFDFYCCFPSAVEMAADAVGIALDDPRGLTVTGGLPYFGGPGNNYMTHGIATMAENLRGTGGLGLCSSPGGFMTKHGVTVLGATPPPDGFRRGDTGADQAMIDARALTVAVDDDIDGDACRRQHRALCRRRVGRRRAHDRVARRRATRRGRCPPRPAPGSRGTVARRRDRSCARRPTRVDLRLTPARSVGAELGEDFLGVLADVRRACPRA